MRPSPSFAQSEENLRLALIFPPAMHPTSPPLGVACLKAFLKHEGFSGSVRTFDLNLSHYEQSLEWLADERLKLKLRGLDQETTARSAMEACEFLGGGRGMEAFLRQPDYDRHASLYRSFESVWNGFLDHCLRRFVTGMPLPPLVSTYFDALIEPVKAFRPSVIGFSVLFSQQLYWTLALAKKLKETGAAVVLGGATLAVMPHPENLLTEHVPVLVDREKRSAQLGAFVDFLILGEGESGLAALMRSSPETFSRVPGLVYKQNGQIRRNESRMAADLDALPLPDFDDLPLKRYHSPRPVLPYLSSRGCFWQRCTFCTHRKTYLAYREETAERTVEHLSELACRYGVDTFSLVDEMIHPNRMRQLSRLIGKRSLNMRYSAYAKPTKGYDRSLLEAFHDSGGRVLLWGVESGSQRVLDAMRKGAQAAEMEKVLQTARYAGVWNFVFVMFGFPSETREEWQMTLDLLHRRRDVIDALSSSLFVLLPGSDVFRSPEQYGITRIKDRHARDPVSVGYDYEVCKGLSQEEAQALYTEQELPLRRCGRSPHLAVLRDHLLIHAAGAERERR